MTVNIQTYLKDMPTGQMLGIGLIVILAITVTSGFIRIQTEQVIAPPGFRVMDWLWKVFVCRCLF